MTDLPTLLSRATPEQLAEALIEAMEAIPEAQKTLADLTNPDEPSGAQIVAMYVRCRSSELRLRKALSYIDAILTNDRVGAPEKENDR